MLLSSYIVADLLYVGRTLHTVLPSLRGNEVRMHLASYDCSQHGPSQLGRVVDGISSGVRKPPDTPPLFSQSSQRIPDPLASSNQA